MTPLVQPKVKVPGVLTRAPVTSQLPETAMAEAQRLCAGADLLLCIGSSLEVYPVAGLPELTLSSGGQLAIVTQGPTPYDGEAVVKLDGDVVAELDAVLAAL